MEFGELVSWSVSGDMSKAKQTVSWRMLILLLVPWLASCTAFSGSPKPRVLVVGAGIVGASITYHLAKRGAQVTVIDKQAPASHASRGTFAWVNSTYARQPRYYHRFSQQSVAYWHELQQELSLPVRWVGSLEWFDDDNDQARLSGLIDEQAQWGEPARMVGIDELHRLEPNVDFGHAKQAALSANDGHVDPIAATQTFLEASKNLGASVKYPCELEDVTFDQDRLARVTTSCGIMSFDHVVLATGAAADAPKRFAAVDIPQRTRPGIIAITKPLPRLLTHIIVAPGIHLYQRSDGRLVLGEQGGPPDSEVHAARLRGRPKDFPAQVFAEQHAQRMFAIAQSFVPKLAPVEFERIFIGWRPLPLDGHPVLGPSPNRPGVYIAIMHSGVTLAPIVGKRVAQELLDGPVEQLDVFRPSREFKYVQRY